MRAVVVTSLASLLLCSCGGQEQLDLGQGQADNFEQAAMGESCNEPIVASLMPVASSEYSPVLKFVAEDKETYPDAKADPHSPTETRCTELRKHFSGMVITGGCIIQYGLSLEINFSPSAEQEVELLSGKVVDIRPDAASLSVTDGSLNSTSTDLELRCPIGASVWCRVKDLGEYKKCDAYIINFEGQCSFRSKLLLYNFADHKKAQMEVLGEFNTFEDGKGDIKFTKLSWLELD